jgi:nucleotide-binding universal stress UspA family protein
MSVDPISDGPVLFAYDGSDHAKAAIEQAGRTLRPGRALVLTIWQPLESVPFFGAPLAAVPEEVVEGMMERAREVAAEGAELARAAGFKAQPLVESGAPIWARIVEVADQNDAEIVVLGSHGRSGVGYTLLGSVATAVAHHTRRPVMIARTAAG